MTDDVEDSTDWLPRILPFYCLEITLEFTESTRLPFFHRGQLTGFVRTLIDARGVSYAGKLLVESAEDGRVFYRSGEPYRFGITAFEPGLPLLRTLIQKLEGLPASARRDKRRNDPFRDNLRLVSIRDRLAAAADFDPDRLAPYDGERFQHELNLWQAHLRERPLVWRWTSPLRMLLPAAVREQRESADGKTRYCSNPEDLVAGFLLHRNVEALRALLQHHGHDEPQPTPAAAACEFTECRVFWVEDSYKSGARWKHLSGLLGELRFPPLPELSMFHTGCMVLGQHLGMGEQPAFGLGRYRLETDSGETVNTVPPLTPAASLLQRAALDPNLEQAWRIAATRNKREPRLLTNKHKEDLEARLRPGDIRVDPLHLRSLPKKNGGQRMLAVPPFAERVAQRAVVQVLAPALNKYFHRNSHGYRRGHSRHSAAEAIRRAWEEGYRYVFESDIEDFFTSVDWHDIEVRLRALYRHDPVVDHCLAWMRAPLITEGRELTRLRGLPQGSPLSPLLSNLVLDDFDRDLAAENFKMIRYADDFVVLCKDATRLEDAEAEVRRSLAELKLMLREDKTAETDFEQGFRYLGLYFKQGEVTDDPPTQPTTAKPLPNRHNCETRLALSPVEKAERVEQLVERLVGHTPAAPAPAGVEEVGALVAVTGKPSTVAISEGHLRVSREGEILLDRPVDTLESLVLVGPQHITTPALRGAMGRGVPVHFVRRSGEYLGVATSAAHEEGRLTLWRLQLDRLLDTTHGLEPARELVAARIRNLREVLRRLPLEAQVARPRLKRSADKALEVADIAELNGVEGEATREFFAGIRSVLGSEWNFKRRQRHPALDPFNVLLDLGYSILYAHTDATLRVDGLLSALGVYHQRRAGHAALASDMMEPFRHLVERTALHIVRKRMIAPDNFSMRGGRCEMERTALRDYLRVLQERFVTGVTAWGDDRPRGLHGHLHRQNRSLIAWLREESAFRPYRER